MRQTLTKPKKKKELQIKYNAQDVKIYTTTVHERGKEKESERKKQSKRTYQNEFYVLYSLPMSV